MLLRQTLLKILLHHAIHSLSITFDKQTKCIRRNILHSLSILIQSRNDEVDFTNIGTYDFNINNLRQRVYSKRSLIKFKKLFSNNRFLCRKSSTTKSWIKTRGRSGSSASPVKRNRTDNCSYQ